MVTRRLPARPAPVAAKTAARPAPRPAPRRTAPARPPAAPTSAQNAAAGVDLAQRLQWNYVDITDIQPYPYNPRDNADAIQSVANSIRAYGFVIPIVLDENNVIIAGHTRVEAAKTLGMTEVPALLASHLTPEQATAFRLIDNKVAEGAKWDFDLLAGEIAKLGEAVDFTQFGWRQEEIDCLKDVVADSCLTDGITVTPEEAQATSQRRAPTQARFVLGEFVFFIPAATYRNWADGIRQLHDFNEEAIAADIKRRLSILE